MVEAVEMAGEGSARGIDRRPGGGAADEADASRMCVGGGRLAGGVETPLAEAEVTGAGEATPEEEAGVDDEEGVTGMLKLPMDRLVGSEGAAAATGKSLPLPPSRRSVARLDRSSRSFISRLNRCISSSPSRFSTRPPPMPLPGRDPGSHSPIHAGSALSSSSRSAAPPRRRLLLLLMPPLSPPPPISGAGFHAGRPGTRVDDVASEDEVDAALTFGREGSAEVPWE